VKRTWVLISLLVGILLALALVALAGSAPGLQSGSAVPGAVEVWVTTGEGSERLHRRSDVRWETGAGDDVRRIQVDNALVFQPLAGVGAALTDASAWVISNTLEPTRTHLLNELFSPAQGIGLSYLRLPMGASDFTPPEEVTGWPVLYTYADDGSFSVARDDAAHYNRIPLLDQAQAINPQLRWMASPWTAPAWMKDSGSPFGGSLRTEYYSAYAAYFVRYTLAYQAEGLPPHAVTVQNEPLHESDRLPSMRMSPGEQAVFVRDHLGPAFVEAGIDVEILIHDHNWDRYDVPLAILGDAAARSYIAGTAWHCYSGTVSAQSIVHDAYPEVGAYLTECTGHYAHGAGQGPDDHFAGDLVWEVQNLVIGATRNEAETVLMWNLALDPQGGPHLPGACGESEGVRCRGLATVDASGTVARHAEYYALGHLSKFVQPGALRIASSHLTGTVESVAFRNTDRSIALLVVNPQGDPHSFDVIWGGSYFSYTLPGRSVATFKWPPVHRAHLPLVLSRLVSRLSAGAAPGQGIPAQSSEIRP
jgi:glucosylceramidase